MKLVTVEVEGKTYAEIENGKPVYLDADEKRVTVDAGELSKNLSDAMAEAKNRRLTNEELTAKLKEFEGLDAKEARQALSKLKDFSDKELIEAGEAERVRAEAVQAVQAELEAERERAGKLTSRLNDAVLGRMFSDSAFIKDKVVVPTEMIRATFGNRFKLEEDGQITALDADGKVLMSKRAETAGRAAGFEEAIEIMVNQSSFKDQILKGANNSGGGGTGGSGGAGAHQITRDEYEALTPQQQRKAISDKVQIIDAA